MSPFGLSATDIQVRHADCHDKGMTSHDFFPKLTDFSGRRSRPGVGLLSLGVGAAALLALNWLLRRFAPAPQTVVTVVVLCILVGMLVALVRRNIEFTEQSRRAGPAPHSTTFTAAIDESGIKATPVAMQQRSTPLNETDNSDAAWAAAVVSYEAAMQRLAAGKLGSRTEAQTSALELARLQGLLVQASRPHLPLGLEPENAGLTADIL